VRTLWLLCLAAGCEFSASPSSTTGAGDDDPGQGPGGTDPGAAPPAQCDVTGDPSVRLCVTFDHDPLVQDLSSDNHQVTAMGVAKISRTNGSPAASLTTTSRVHLADDGMFNVAQLTIDMWIAPAEGSLGHRSWMLDNNTHYFLSYEADGKIRCGIGSKVVTSKVAITDAAWHHVACTYGSNHELHVYVDGDRSGCLQINPGTPTTNTNGIALGANYGGDGSYTENYAGGIDGVHVYARAMSDTEVCTAAGHQGCGSVSCDQGGPGGPGPGGPGGGL
jgi:Concanavalin A-like lectin/glucanases superfamily